MFFQLVLCWELFAAGLASVWLCSTEFLPMFLKMHWKLTLKNKFISTLRAQEVLTTQSIILPDIMQRLKDMSIFLLMNRFKLNLSLSWDKYTKYSITHSFKEYMTSGFKESCLTSSFSCIMTWAFRLATLENFLLHTWHLGSLVVWVDLWRPRLYSTLKDIGHWSHRYGCIQEEVMNSYVISSSWQAHLPLLPKQEKTNN